MEHTHSLMRGESKITKTVILGKFRAWKSFSAASHGIRTTAILHLHGNVVDKNE